MTQFFTAETAVNAYLTAGHWTPCKATTEAAAKRIAQAARTFQGTEAHVGTLHADGSINVVATRTPGGGWEKQE